MKMREIGVWSKIKGKTINQNIFMLKKIDTTIWVSNLSTKTGEGTLAKYFLK
jgi:hypothetical protein